MKTSSQKWVVAFPGARDDYQVPLALAQTGKLEALITDNYAPLDRFWFQAAVRCIPNVHRVTLRKRFREGVPSKLVRVPRSALSFAGFGMTESPSAIANRAADLSCRTGAPLFSYAHVAFSAFLRRELPTPKVLFQFHPHPKALLGLYQQEIDCFPQAEGSIRKEYELVVSPERLSQISEEAKLADYCVAASNFTRQSLVAAGVEPSRIFTIPYGVDLHYFHPAPRSNNTTFKVLFAGQITQRKGVYYLLHAWKRLALKNAELILAGYGLHPGIESAAGPNVQIRGKVSKHEMRSLMQQCDVLCVPSIAEGFGLVYLEALACGTPVIGTPNTGLPDIADQSGAISVLPIRDVDAICEQLYNCYVNRERLEELRVQARSLAEQYTWSQFRARVVDTLDTIIDKRCERVAR